jgi:glycosyltransferase involved in cell wall biosynthesis
VGFLGENSARGAGIVVPLDEQRFVEETVKHLIYYRDNPIEYQQCCESTQQFAREHYDWSVVIDKWIEILE